MPIRIRYVAMALAMFGTSIASWGVSQAREHSPSDDRSVPQTTATPAQPPDDSGRGRGGRGSGSRNDQDRTPPPGAIVIDNFSFEPSVVNVRSGATVTWFNKEDNAHTTSATSGAWDSGSLGRGGTFSFTPTVAGAYEYVCNIHPQMHGTVVVDGVTTPPALPPPAPPMAPPGQAGAVTVRDFAFDPPTLGVVTGATVTWTNTGRASHTVTERTGRWDSGDLAPGGSFTFTFSQPGTYAYQCNIHPSMQAAITVTDSGAGPPAQPPTGAGTPAAAVPSPTALAPPDATAAPAVATVRDFAFEPATLTVAVGATVTWTNTGQARHTVTSDTSVFDSGSLAREQTFSWTADQPGVYAYHCEIHPAMTGVILVQDATGGATPPIPTNAASGSTSGMKLLLFGILGAVTTLGVVCAGAWRLTGRNR